MIPFIVAIGATSFLMSCQERKELQSDAKREITTLDQQAVPLNPTSDDRFTSPDAETAPTSGGLNGAVGSAPVADYSYTAGESWTPLPATQFRNINFSLPEGGEIYLSVAGGGILPNLNRWLKQFGQEALTPTELSQLPKMNILGQEGYLIEARGDFAGMRGGTKPDYALLGSLTEVNGSLITVKLIAPPEVVERERAAFTSFCESLQQR